MNSSLPRKLVFLLGIVTNIGLLGYFKYANFILENLQPLLNTTLPHLDIELPLGISFFTFTQIAYLVDVYRRATHESNPLSYALFVSYFPHLIAGPILHHKQMMPQFSLATTFNPSWQRFAVGMSFFALGLAKKLLIADSLAEYVDPFVGTVDSGTAPAFWEAWTIALAYSCQLYFDFSGYCDMAYGISYLFGIYLPFNFNSPYQAANIIDFWRRWHMSLSQFMREYVYIPLGGNRHGSIRRHVNLMCTMLVGGLWHGASWNFVLWGGLHGVFLWVNHLWRASPLYQQCSSIINRQAYRIAARALTFLCVVLAWIPFRASSWDSTLRFWQAMLWPDVLVLPASLQQWLSSLNTLGVEFASYITRPFFPLEGCFPLLASALLIAWCLPNTQNFLIPTNTSNSRPPSTKLWQWQWQANLPWALVMGIILGLSLLTISRPSPFLYFQF